ncbi:MAG: FlgD immunoglobulin-like domain containing protein, partial [Desulfovibrionaceae bacterium]
QLVYTETLPSQQKGSYDFNWTGKTLTGGNAPDGVYTVRMACQTDKGAPIIMDSQVEGEVAGVRNENGIIYLRLTDGRVVSLANVRQVGATTPKEPEKPAEKPEEKPEEKPVVPPVNPDPEIPDPKIPPVIPTSMTIPEAPVIP